MLVHAFQSLLALCAPRAASPCLVRRLTDGKNISPAIYRTMKLIGKRRVTGLSFFNQGGATAKTAFYFQFTGFDRNSN